MTLKKCSVFYRLQDLLLRNMLKFIIKDSIRINIDVNGAYQIMKKVFPKVTAEGIEDVALHPVRVSVV